MVKKSTQIAVLTYGILLVALGILGYVKAGSAMSLYAGSTSKTLPALLAVLSGGMLLYLLAALTKWRRS